jgi:hypothetical protein
VAQVDDEWQDIPDEWLDKRGEAEEYDGAFVLAPRAGLCPSRSRWFLRLALALLPCIGDSRLFGPLPFKLALARLALAIALRV